MLKTVKSKEIFLEFLALFFYSDESKSGLARCTDDRLQPWNAPFGTFGDYKSAEREQRISEMPDNICKIIYYVKKWKL